MIEMFRNVNSYRLIIPFSPTVKHPVPVWVKLSLVIFDIQALCHSGLSGAQMSKITNDVLTRSGTGCFIAVPCWRQWVFITVRGLTRDWWLLLSELTLSPAIILPWGVPSSTWADGPGDRQPRRQHPAGKDGHRCHRNWPWRRHRHLYCTRRGTTFCVFTLQTPESHGN